MGAKVSVVIPAYNVAPFVEECLCSIMNQTYRDIEIIIVDDGSIDLTFDICQKQAISDDRIVLIHQDNKGVVEARYAGINEAKGDYISFVDADDYIAPNMIKTLVDSIGDADLVSMGVVCEDQKDYFVKRRDCFPPGVYEGIELFNIYKKMIYDMEKDISHPITTWMYNKLYRTEMVKKIYPYIDKNLSFSEDAVFVYKYLLECNKVIFIDSFLYYYRYHEESALHKNDIGRLSKINSTYEALIDITKDQSKEYMLDQQIYRWLLERCYIALNEKMGQKKDHRIIRYLLKNNNYSNKRVAIFGAGRVGRDIYYQLNMLGYSNTLWVDKRYEALQKENLPVSSPDNIVKRDCDVVLIAVESVWLRKEIEKDLLAIGIPQSRINSNCFVSLF